MKSNPEDRKYFFALRDIIHTKLKDDGVVVTKKEVYEAIKHQAELDKSINDMTKQDLQMLKEAGKLFAYRIGLDID